VSYGTGIVVNWFYPLAVNAAMGIAHQVNGAITGLTSNFQTAFQPQITKSYAAKDYEYLGNLIAYTAKISFFLLFIVTYPILLNIDAILGIWLTTVPEYTNWFCILFIIASIFNAISAPLWIAIFATGRIKTYQIIVSLVFFSDLVIVYLLFKLGLPPVTCMIVKAAINFIVIFIRVFFAKKEVEVFSAGQFIKGAVVPCFLAALLTVGLSLPVFLLCSSVVLKILVTAIALVLSIVLAYYIGLNKVERVSVKGLVLSYLHINK
jgi:Na+-driven multidrug efflux pump